jgi:hypothetical protein
MDHNRTPKFFVKFAMKGIGRGFTGFNFTSREFPVARESFTRGTMYQQKEIIPLNNGTDDVGGESFLRNARHDTGRDAPHQPVTVMDDSLDSLQGRLP